jgi:hypothetical protein
MNISLFVLKLEEVEKKCIIKSGWEGKLTWRNAREISFPDQYWSFRFLSPSFQAAIIINPSLKQEKYSPVNE